MIINNEEGKRTRIVRRITEKKKEFSKLASSLFEPPGKNPYYLNRGSNSTAIRNLIELRDNLDAFTNGEVHWVASWLEYLGDKEIATRLREMPEKFKEIIMERCNELREFYH
jgi:predicted DNA-binding antitoxin AbrB/MazE fold protein